MEFTQEEKDGLVDIIDGTIETLNDDVDFTSPEFAFWIGVLNKLGETGQQSAREWLELGQEEATTEAESAALLDLVSKLG